MGPYHLAQHNAEEHLAQMKKRWMRMFPALYTNTEPQVTFEHPLLIRPSDAPKVSYAEVQVGRFGAVEAHRTSNDRR